MTATTAKTQLRRELIGLTAHATMKMTLDALRLDGTGKSDEEIADLLQFPYITAFEMDENDIPVRRMVWGEREWKPYTVPWPTEDTNKNHDVCRKLQEKIKT